MQKFEAISDKFLAKSLNLINNLLAKSLNFSASHIILPNDNQNTHWSTFINDNSLNTEELSSSNKHPFKGLASNIKSITLAPIFSSAGDKLGYLVLLDDKEHTLSTEEKSTLLDFVNTITNTIEKHLESQQLQLVFTDFIHKTIHDLKNPLTSISLTTELLKRKAEDPKMVINFSEKLDKANKRLFSNLEDLKSAFPIDERSFKLNNTEVNLNELLQNIKIEANNIAFNLKNSPEIIVFGDYSRLKEAIKQLVTHISAAAIEIKLYISENAAVIEITTNEIITGTRSSALAISKTLIQMHKGKIETSEKGYAIYLPIEVS